MRSKYSRQKSSKFTDLVRNVKKSKFLVSVAVLALISTQNLVLSQEQFDEQDVIRSKLPIDLLNSDNLNIDNNKWSLDEYKYLSYKEMRTRMYQLQEKYPNIMEIETSEEMFDIGHEAFCGNEVCQLDIVTLTDFQVDSSEKAQVYISGALHGDEVIGPNVAFYLIEYILSQSDEQFVANLLKQREIIITPMTNAVGYYHHEREERINTTSSIYLKNSNKKVAKNNKIMSFDINRDFPYNTQNKQCLNTIAGRVIHEIFTQNVIVSSLTFHGGINVIGYPWGSYNRVSYTDIYRSKETPDEQMFESVGWIMKNETGQTIPRRDQDNIPFTIDEYIFGDISSTIYPVSGGLEDWGYGGGWDNKEVDATLFQCTPQTYLLSSHNITQSKEAYKNVRSAIYIVETDNSKKPDERTLGKRLIQESDVEGAMRIKKESIEEKNGRFDGHINRNIRLAMAIIDLSKPYIEIVDYKDIGNDKVEVTWKVNGCHTLNEAKAIVNGLALNLLAQNQTGICNYPIGRNHGKQSVFTVTINSNDEFLLEAVTDQHFGVSKKNQDVSPSGFYNTPQTHLAQTRLQENYEAVGPRKTYKGSKTIKMTKEQCKDIISLREETRIKMFQKKNRKLQGESNFQKAIEGKEALSVVLQPVYDQRITGVFSLVETAQGQFTLNGRMNNMPLQLEVEVKIMNYGDLSSLAVEYPDYNSLGQPLISLLKATSTVNNQEAYKISQTSYTYPQNITKLSDLTGRAMIITWEKDLMAYGILSNETRIAENKTDLSSIGKSTQAVAFCENLLATVQYRAIFQLSQKNDRVTFEGLLRTSDKMEDEYELILSLNHRKSFDLDFKNAYQLQDPQNYQQVMHPCYMIEKEQVEGQDWLLGRDLNMYGSHEDFDTQILQQSKCHIGIQNPDFRVSDERFCQTILDRKILMGQGDRKYTLNNLINIFLVGFMAGLIIAFLFYISTKVTYKTEDDEDNERLKTAARMEFIELQDTSVSQRNNEEALDDEF